MVSIRCFYASLFSTSLCLAPFCFPSYYTVLHTKHLDESNRPL